MVEVKSIPINFLFFLTYFFGEKYSSFPAKLGAGPDKKNTHQEMNWFFFKPFRTSVGFFGHTLMIAPDFYLSKAKCLLQLAATVFHLPLLTYYQ